MSLGVIIMMYRVAMITALAGLGCSGEWTDYVRAAT